MSIIICVADMIKPNEKYDKQLKILFSLMFVLSILIPLAKSDFNLEIEPIENVSVDYSDDMLENEIKNNIEKALRIKLNEQNITVEKLDVITHIEDNGSISISKVDFKTSNDTIAKTIINANLNISEG
jgi:hypothetical protein